MSELEGKVEHITGKQSAMISVCSEEPGLHRYNWYTLLLVTLNRVLPKVLRCNFFVWMGLNPNLEQRFLVT